MNRQFWSGKRVFVTGHSGFKGGWLALWLSELGAEALLEALELMAADQLQETEQDHDLATFAPKIDRETARIDWSRCASELVWHIRAMDAVPGAWSELAGAPVKLFRPSLAEARPSGAREAVGRGNGGPPTVSGAASPEGLVIHADETHGLVVGSREGALLVDEVQPPGRRRMPARDWIHGRGVSVGQRFL